MVWIHYGLGYSFRLIFTIFLTPPFGFSLFFLEEFPKKIQTEIFIEELCHIGIQVLAIIIAVPKYCLGFELDVLVKSLLI